MTEKKTTTKKAAPKKSDCKKPLKTLYDAVTENPTPNYIIMGALSKAGLLAQYNHERDVYGVEDIAPSITPCKLKGIIKKYVEGK